MDIEGLSNIFLKICEKFNQVGVDYVVGGGFAIILHGLPRMTDDVDFFVDPSPENVEKIKALSKKMHPEDLKYTQSALLFPAVFRGAQAFLLLGLPVLWDLDIEDIITRLDIY